MGYNTIIFALNDFFNEAARSPHTVAWTVTNPPQSRYQRERDLYRQMASHTAMLYQERPLHPQVLEVLPTFHASEQKFFTAGGNCISELQVLRTQIDRTTGRRVVVLDLPDYLQEKGKVY